MARFTYHCPNCRRAFLIDISDCEDARIAILDDTPGSGNIRDKSDEGVRAEYLLWDAEIKSETCRGAALSVADKFRQDAARELKRRGLEIPE